MKGKTSGTLHQSYQATHRYCFSLSSDKNKPMEYSSFKHGDILAEALQSDCFVGEKNVSVQSNSLKRAYAASGYVFPCFVNSCFVNCLQLLLNRGFKTLLPRTRFPQA
jgi:hypothetical protein